MVVIELPISFSFVEMYNGDVHEPLRNSFLLSHGLEENDGVSMQDLSPCLV